MHPNVSHLIERLPPLGREIAHRLINEDFVGEAAKMAYFFFLSIFPALLIVFAFTGFVGGDIAFARITTIVFTITPPDASAFLHRFVLELAAERRPGMLSAGALILFWAGSSGIAALTEALNRVHGVSEGRGWWSRRVLALAILAIGSILIVLGTVIVVGGVAALRALGLSAVWDVLRWPLAAALPLLALWLAFYFLPDRGRHGGMWEAFVGATIATLLWAIATALFSVYLGSIRDYSRVYGAIGTVMALLIWFFLSAYAVLLGGLVDASLERRHRQR
ncbi:MAG TPA: YihY/virulence factor BrkB family protein [Gemmatimonadaceae bacterium]|nr:YihY/virulence factor BrkB family protein [Gemmatimonadaceae bacterium]